MRNLKKMRHALLGFRLVALLSFPLTLLPDNALGEYVALVEDASEKSKYKAFDFLTDGLVIELSADQFIKLGYFGSCLSEHIVGGKIIIGRFRSTVFGSQVTRETVSCDGGRLILEPDQLAQSGVDVFRGADGMMEYVIYHAYPILISKSVISEFDFVDEISGEHVKVFGEGRVLDFSAISRKLKFGNSYLLSKGGFSCRIKVENPVNVDVADLSPLSRVVRLP